MSYTRENIEVNATRLFWLDILKGIGIILVLIGHIYSNNIIFNWIYSFHMPLFFMAAGYTYKEKSVLEDIKRRFQTIVVPYFSFGLLVLLYWVVLERRFRESSMTPFESFIGLLRGQYSYLDFNVHLWFLPCFFMTAVLFNVMMNVGRKIENRNKPGLCGGGGYCRLAYFVSAMMSLVVILCYYFDSPLPELPWGIDNVFRYIGFYAVGYFLHQRNIVDELRKVPKVGAVIVAVILLALNFLLSYAGLTIGMMRFVTAFVGVAAIWIIAVLINRNLVLQYLGQISLVILCVHGPAYRIIIKLLSIVAGMSTYAVRENFILAMLIVVLTIAVCATVHGVMIRETPWMVGKKSKINEERTI